MSVLQSSLLASLLLFLLPATTRAQPDELILLSPQLQIVSFKRPNKRARTLRPQKIRPPQKNWRLQCERHTEEGQQISLSLRLAPPPDEEAPSAQPITLFEASYTPAQHQRQKPFFQMTSIPLPGQTSLTLLDLWHPTRDQMLRLALLTSRNTPRGVLQKLQLYLSPTLRPGPLSNPYLLDLPLASSFLPLLSYYEEFLLVPEAPRRLQSLYGRARSGGW